MELRSCIPHKAEDNVQRISVFMLVSLVLFSFFEVFFFPQAENVYGCFVFFVGWIFLYTFVLRVKGIKRNKCLLPYLAMFGLGVTFFWLPLIATLLESKPLTFRFQNPYLTFNNQLINLVMLIAAYRLCLSTYKRNNWLQQLWKKIGYFTPPTDKQIWAMGIIGMLAFVFLLSLQGSDGGKAENLGFLGQVCGVLSPLNMLPFLLFFKECYGGNSQKKQNALVLIFYFVLMVVLGLATGKRTTILGPVMTLVVCYLIPFFTENRRIFTIRNTIILFASLYLVTGPVANMAMAMAVGRDNSGRSNSTMTFNNIMNIYQDKELLHSLYQMSISDRDNLGNNLNGWSEYYVDNVLFDRFCNIRVCDATLFYANRLGFDNPRMHEYMTNKMLFLLPTPILRALGIQVNKFESLYTPGDLLSTEGLGLRQQYRGFRVAGDTGIGLYLWGYKYYILAFFLYYALFYFLSSKILVTQEGKVIIPVAEIIVLFKVFLTFNNDTGIVNVVSTLLRTGWQAVVVYCLIFFAVRKIIR